LTKSTVTKTWIAGLVALAAGLVVAAIGIFVMLAYGGTFERVAGTAGSYNFVPNLDSFFWTGVGAIVLGGILALIGGMVQLAAWIGALVNSYQLADKTWFVVLVLGGVLAIGFGLIGFAVMVAYVVAAPDGSLYRKAQVQAPAQAPPAPTPTALAPTG
jgi:hypothetical protein